MSSSVALQRRQKSVTRGSCVPITRQTRMLGPQVLAFHRNTGALMASLSSSVTSSSRENRQNPFEEVSRDFGKIQSNLASCQKLLRLPSPLSMPSESLRELSSNLQHYRGGSRKGGRVHKGVSWAVVANDSSHIRAQILLEVLTNIHEKEAS